MMQELFFNFAEPTPMAMANFVDQPRWARSIRKHDENGFEKQGWMMRFVPFKKKMKERIVSPYSTFDVHVRLEVPESTHNQNVGMFQVKAELVTQKGETISDSMRPAVLRYRSPLVRWIRTVVYWPFHVAGFVEEKQTIDVHMFSKIREGRDFTQAAVRLLPRENDTRRIPEVYSASATIALRMNLMQKALYFYPFISTITLIMFNWFCLNAFVIVVTSLFFLVRSTSGSPKEGRGDDETEDLLIESIVASEDDTIAVSTTSERTEDQAVDEDTQIPERRDKTQASIFRKHSELRQRK